MRFVISNKCERSLELCMFKRFLPKLGMTSVLEFLREIVALTNFFSLVCF